MEFETLHPTKQISSELQNLPVSRIYIIPPTINIGFIESAGKIIPSKSLVFFEGDFPDTVNKKKLQSALFKTLDKFFFPKKKTHTSSFKKGKHKSATQP